MVNCIWLYLPSPVSRMAQEKVSRDEKLKCDAQPEEGSIIPDLSNDKYVLTFVLILLDKYGSSEDLENLTDRTSPNRRRGCTCCLFLWLSPAVTASPYGIKKPSGFQWSCCYLWRDAACLQQRDWMRRFTFSPSEFPVVGGALGLFWRFLAGCLSLLPVSIKSDLHVTFPVWVVLAK